MTYEEVRLAYQLPRSTWAAAFEVSPHAVYLWERGERTPPRSIQVLYQRLAEPIERNSRRVLKTYRDGLIQAAQSLDEYPKSQRMPRKKDFDPFVAFGIGILLGVLFADSRK